MPTFRYRVRDYRGAPLEQTAEADNATILRSQLREKGMYVIEIAEVKPEQPGGRFSLEALRLATTRITVRDKSLLARQLSALTNAGVALVRSLTVLEEQTSNRKLKKYLAQINVDVQQGSSLAGAMRKFPDAFDNLFVAMITAGEQGGVLDEVLERLSKLLEDQDRLQRQVRSALAYPITVLVLAVGIFLAMVTFILPVFKGIFDQLGGTLPAFTQLLMSLSTFLQQPLNWLVLVALVAFVVWFYRRTYRSPRGRRSIDRVRLWLPLFGDLIRKAAIARFCRTFGVLFRSGVDVLRALEIVRDTAGNTVIADAVDAARQTIREGGMISPTLQQERAFPPMAVQMIRVGEESGELDSMLTKVADFYELEVEQAIKSLTSLLEPLLIVVLGGLVGSVILAMYLPLFTVFDLIK
ncbi:type II secretion system F family protein [Gloeobacter kilaueensis]|uniref:Type II secretion system protein n=1 Tax=Gloeobacter kilaueensis (strain ATCC BAA-2537 / CCAP 1431/1 / ULC 316 / JS1) TaxID=1183438 RepID=U5QHM0_GLOK1|nr:type II secretion system F family protein [Gloeobacter kilaueensis]AGY58416.1 type II secretion system protein [Gloeobacter kilaueensis JS1]